MGDTLVTPLDRSHNPSDPSDPSDFQVLWRIWWVSNISHWKFQKCRPSWLCVAPDIDLSIALSFLGFSHWPDISVTWQSNLSWVTVTSGQIFGNIVLTCFWHRRYRDLTIGSVTQWVCGLQHVFIFYQQLADNDMTLIKFQATKQHVWRMFELTKNRMIILLSGVINRGLLQNPPFSSMIFAARHFPRQPPLR